MIALMTLIRHLRTTILLWPPLVLLEGHQLSSAASRDLGQRLAGKIKRPCHKLLAKPKVNENQIICRVISILKRYANIPPKRNEASDGFSGSDVVAETVQRSCIKSQTPRGRGNLAETRQRISVAMPQIRMPNLRYASRKYL